jgi:hypothetical protein
VQEGIRHPGHACKSPLHAPLQYLHSATMCDAVWQPLEDGEDTFCSKACVAAYNAKLKAKHEDGLAGVPVEDEPLLPPDFLPLRQSSSCGASSPVRGSMQTPSIGEPRGPVGRAGHRPEHLSVCRIGRSSLRYRIGRNVCYRLGEPSVTGQ